MMIKTNIEKKRMKWPESKTCISVRYICREIKRKCAAE
jgi:hypothetical protein